MASSCSICLSTTAESADRGWCVLSKCGHTFHEDCLSRACATNPRCPNCRVHSSDLPGCIASRRHPDACGTRSHRVIFAPTCRSDGLNRNPPLAYPHLLVLDLQEGICLRQSDRDGSVLRKNLVLPIRLDLSGEDASQLQQSLSPASDRLKRQVT